MNKIIILDEGTSNQIAAGEVVERPASAVKELVENSIDSGANAISVEIINGGIKEIKVSDNGSGMSADDLQAAFERHSTSKIRTIHDLDTLSSFGFRGEALASIASVSRVKMTSREKNAVEGSQILLEAGKVIEFNTTSCSYGTTITINDLFYNVPARFKFLKSDSVETSHISDILQKISLANPDVSIKFISNKKNVFITPGNGELKSTVYSLYGKETSDNLSYVDHAFGAYRITGLSGNPTLFRKNRDFQTVFVNKRYIKSKIFNIAADKAYSEFMIKGRYPVFFLNLIADPALIDINVHPQKLEARFTDEKTIFTVLNSALSQNLSFVREYSNTTQGFADFKTDKIQEKYIPRITEVLTDTETASINIFTPRSDIVSAATPVTPNEFKKQSFDDFTENLLTVGQIFKTYIIFEKSEKMILMDQHAAHERILYERILASQSAGTTDSQQLLQPEIISLSAREMETYKNNVEFMEKTGYDAAEFGNDQCIIRAIPAELIHISAKESFAGILEQLRNQNFEPTAENIAMIACKSAVKANRSMNQAESEALLRQLAFVSNPMHCPHGRPIFHVIYKKELEKAFQRT